LSSDAVLAGVAIIIRGTVPADEFALSHALQQVPELEIECERVVQSSEHSILPLLWVRAPDGDAVEAALEEDPTVDRVSCLSAFETESLYRMEWVDHVRLLLQMITNGDATILDAHGRDGHWQLRALYPDREDFSRTHEFVADHGLTFDVDSIREMNGDPSGRFGLTDDQYDALVEAAKRGYYDVPRSVTL
jgi:predicted DNA binding protein